MKSILVLSTVAVLLLRPFPGQEPPPKFHLEKEIPLEGGTSFDT